MSESSLFEIGAVIFLIVVTAVFWYGLARFQAWEDGDERAADHVLAVDRPTGADAA